MDDFMVEVDDHGNIKVTSYVEAVAISKEEQEQALRIFKQLQEENAALRELVVRIWNTARLMDANRQVDGMRITDDFRAECEGAFNKLGIEA